MAVLTTIHCTTCGEVKNEVRPASDYSSICNSCKAIIKNRAEIEWKNSREDMSLIERIRDLEDFMYYHDEQFKKQVLY